MKKNIKLCNSTNRQQVIDVPQIEAYRFSHRYRPILSYYHNASHKQAGSASLSAATLRRHCSSVNHKSLAVVIITIAAAAAAAASSS